MNDAYGEHEDGPAVHAAYHRYVEEVGDPMVPYVGVVNEETVNLLLDDTEVAPVSIARTRVST